MRCYFCENDIGDSTYIKKDGLIICERCARSISHAFDTAVKGEQIPWQVIYIPWPPLPPSEKDKEWAKEVIKWLEQKYMSDPKERER